MRPEHWLDTAARWLAGDRVSRRAALRGLGAGVAAVVAAALPGGATSQTTPVACNGLLCCPPLGVCAPEVPCCFGDRLSGTDVCGGQADGATCTCDMQCKVLHCTGGICRKEDQVFTPAVRYGVTGPGSLVAAESITLDPAGNTVVANTGTGRITTFRPDGVLLREFVAGSTEPDILPRFVVYNPLANALTVLGQDSLGQILFREYELSGLLLRTVAVAGGVAPCFLAIDGARGIHYVMNELPSGGGEILAFGPNLTLQRRFGATELTQHAHGIAVASDGALYVAHTGGRELVSYTPAGRLRSRLDYASSTGPDILPHLLVSHNDELTQLVRSASVAGSAAILETTTRLRVLSTSEAGSTAPDILPQGLTVRAGTGNAVALFTGSSGSFVQEYRRLV